MRKNAVIGTNAASKTEVSASAPNTSTATCSRRNREPTRTCTTKNAGKQTANVAKNRNGSLTPADTACAGPQKAPPTRPQKPAKGVIVATADRSLLRNAAPPATPPTKRASSPTSAFRKKQEHALS